MALSSVSPAPPLFLFPLVMREIVGKPLFEVLLLLRRHARTGAATTGLRVATLFLSGGLCHHPFASASTGFTRFSTPINRPRSGQMWESAPSRFTLASVMLLSVP